MTTLLERVRAALAPDYEVERELASGGMGVIFVGRDVALDRRVAIKIVRPDRATATATERFVREARVLASISHPNLIPVHRAGESAGVFYYVMDYLEAETLAERLARGPLPPAEAAAVAADVLGALEAIHRRGIVHRDVKPGNVFLLEGRAVVGDLGVAKTSGSGEPLTDGDKAVGSPGYMAPEQMAGREVSPATDLYALGLVLYEALTGRKWSFDRDPAHGDWSGVPRPLVPTLERALAWAPADRWPGAAAFRAALVPAARSRRRALAWVGAGAAALLILLAVRDALGPWRSAPPPVLRIYVRPFEVRAPAARWLGDSLPAALVRSVGGAADLAAAPLGAGPVPRGALVLHGTVEAAEDGALRLALAADTPAAATPIDLAVSGPAAQWEGLADSLGYRLLLAIWTRRGGTLAADLPVRALPRSGRGIVAWIAAERLFARAQWTAAGAAYRRAIEVDSSCLLCRVRLTDVNRWVDMEPDTASIARYRDALGVFPSHYRRLIKASFAPPDQRFELLRDVTDRFGDFGLGWFIEADDLFHRGGFEGYSLADAYAGMRHATIVWPDFAPAWEHLAWLAIVEGDSATGRTALDSLARIGGGDDPFELSIRALLDVAYRWRFTPATEAAAYTDASLRSAAVARMADISAGPRYLLNLGAPRGAIFLAQRFEHSGRPDLVRPGLLAQVYAFLAMGLLDSAAAAESRLRAATTEPDVDLYLAELPAALLLADSASPAEIRRRAPEATRALRGYASGAPGTSVARRAAWLLALLARRAGDTDAARSWTALLSGETGAKPFGTLVEAAADADRGRLRAALVATLPLVALDSGWQAGDPFFRAMLHLERAQWNAAGGNASQAVRDLRWAENSDLRVSGSAAAAPEAAEVDWSLGTLAAWRRARLHDAAADTALACGAYAAVVRLWSGGDPPYAARADSAARRLRDLRCGRAA